MLSVELSLLLLLLLLHLSSENFVKVFDDSFTPLNERIEPSHVGTSLTEFAKEGFAEGGEVANVEGGDGGGDIERRLGVKGGRGGGRSASRSGKQNGGSSEVTVGRMGVVGVRSMGVRRRRCVMVVMVRVGGGVRVGVRMLRSGGRSRLRSGCRMRCSLRSYRRQLGKAVPRRAG